MNKTQTKVTFEALDLTDRYTLLSSLPKTYERGVEVGVWEGAFTCHLVYYTSMHITGIDPWCETSSHSDIDYDAETYDPFKRDDDGNVSQEGRYITAVQLLNKLSFRHAHCPHGKWTILRSFSQRVHPYIPPGLDFVYIDALHDYESVKRDIQDWFPKLRSEGILCGHDYNEGNEGTIQAVNEFSEETGFEFRITGTSPEKGDADAPSWLFIKE